MTGNILVGLIFATIIGFASVKVFKDMKNKKCSCGSSCSDAKKSKCGR